MEKYIFLVPVYTGLLLLLFGLFKQKYAVFIILSGPEKECISGTCPES
ncbi:hypothetical protein [Methanosarcina siciliae]|nr:hypothetical protein [Methanosarcina siciliae]